MADAQRRHRFNYTSTGLVLLFLQMIMLLGGFLVAFMVDGSIGPFVADPGWLVLVIPIILCGVVGKALCAIGPNKPIGLVFLGVSLLVDLVVVFGKTNFDYAPLYSTPQHLVEISDIPNFERQVPLWNRILEIHRSMGDSILIVNSLPGLLLLSYLLTLTSQMNRKDLRKALIVALVMLLVGLSVFGFSVVATEMLRKLSTELRLPLVFSSIALIGVSAVLYSRSLLKINKAIRALVIAGPQDINTLHDH